jgi:hypothetical protein
VGAGWEEGAYGVPVRHGQVAQRTSHVHTQLEQFFGGGGANAMQHV